MKSRSLWLVEGRVLGQQLRGTHSHAPGAQSLPGPRGAGGRGAVSTGSQDQSIGLSRAEKGPGKANLHPLHLLREGFGNGLLENRWMRNGQERGLQAGVVAADGEVSS